MERFLKSMAELKLFLVGMVLVYHLSDDRYCSFIYSVINIKSTQGVFAASFSPVVMTYTTETYPRVKRNSN